MSQEPDCDQLDAETRDAVEINGSIYVNITATASRILKISSDDTLEVKTYEEKYVVSKTDA
jgi:hypothetical protein